MNIEFCDPVLGDNFQYVDMHFHTTHSDGSATSKEVIEKIRYLGIGVAITDHNEISGSLEALKLIRSDFLVPGIEVKSKELVDILFYFYTFEDLQDFYKKHIHNNKKKFLHFSKTSLALEYIYHLSTKYRCICSVAHPYGYALRSANRHVFDKHKRTLSKFLNFEVINGGTSRKNNLKTVEYVTKHNKGFTSGSDGHSIYSLGKVLTYSNAKNINEFLNNINSKKAKVIGIETKYGKFGEYGYYFKSMIKKVIK